MEVYEQKVLLDYVFNFIKNTGDTRDVSLILGTTNKILKIKSNEKEENSNLKQDIKDYYQKIKNAKPSNIEKNFKVVKKVFNLADDEIAVFALFYRVNNDKYKIYKKLARYGSDMAELCLDITDALVISDTLYNCGLIDTRGDVPEIPEPITDILSCHITENTLINRILGNKLKTKLKKSDFSHLKDEYDTVQIILAKALKEKKSGINILLYGEPGTGKTEFAKTLAKSLKTPLFGALCEDEDNKEADRDDRIKDLRRKIKICTNAKSDKLLLFDEAEDIFHYNFFRRRTNSKAFVNSLLETNTVPVIWTTNNIEDMDKAYLRRFTYSVKFEKLSDEIQLKFLKKEFKNNDFKISDNEIKRLNQKYDLPLSVITNAVMLTKLTDSGNEKFEHFVKNQITLLNGGSRSREKFNPDKKTEKYNFNLINTDIRLDDLSSKIKSVGNLNFSLCLYGEPGTGKSEYAKQLADDLGLKVLFKRGSDIKSKWVGETEKNIAGAFEEARNKKAVLIFDEADSFLQSRANAQRSWEISQVNEMLTQMEAHPYPFICTTNFQSSLDEASLRRFTFKIKFGYMSQEQVKLGFKHFFDKDVPKEICNIKGLTPGDFATVKKKILFLGTDDVHELKNMLEREVELKHSEELKNSVGF